MKIIILSLLTRTTITNDDDANDNDVIIVKIAMPLLLFNINLLILLVVVCSILDTYLFHDIIRIAALDPEPSYNQYDASMVDMNCYWLGVVDSVKIKTERSHEW